MQENELDASNFLFNTQVYIKEFENILGKVTSCYFMLRMDRREVPLNDENGIRDILLNHYLKKEEIKREVGLTDYLFDKEICEIDSIGRVDIRIMPVKPFISDEAYYILECKRLDSQACLGVSGLNYKYISNGIQRFTTGFYCSFYKTNAMIGFVVEPLDIQNNIEDINYILSNNFNTTASIQKENFIENFEFQYSSKHLTQDGLELKIYHLMFDFVD